MPLELVNVSAGIDFKRLHALTCAFGCTFTWALRLFPSDFMRPHSLVSLPPHLSQSSSSSCSIIAGLRNKQGVGPQQANLHKSFHSGDPLQAVPNNICLHLGVHRPSHLLFLCLPPPPAAPSMLCEPNKSCH